MLAPVAVHTHDDTIFVLHAHLVVDALLNAAAEKPLRKKKEKQTETLKDGHTGMTLAQFF